MQAASTRAIAKPQPSAVPLKALNRCAVAPRQMLIVDPSLPEWLPEVTMQNIRVGRCRAALRFRRDSSGQTHVHVLEYGGLRIIRLPPGDAARPESTDRVTAALRAALDPTRAIVLAGDSALS